MKRVIASLLGLLVAWLALANASAAALEPQQRACPVYDYKSQHVCAPSADSATERGPPAAHDPHTAYNAVDRWSNGASARPDRPTPSPIITYDLPALLVQSAGVATTTLAATPDSSGLLSSFQRSGVATEGAGEAIVYLDRANAHASISVTHGGRTIHTEQIGATGTDAVGAFFSGELSSTTIPIRIPLPNAQRAQQFQLGTEGHVFGPYDLETRSCVTYCADVLRAGGVQGVPDASAGWRRTTLWIFSRDN